MRANSYHKEKRCKKNAVTKKDAAARRAKDLDVDAGVAAAPVAAVAAVVDRRKKANRASSSILLTRLGQKY